MCLALPTPSSWPHLSGPRLHTEDLASGNDDQVAKRWTPTAGEERERRRVALALSDAEFLLPGTLAVRSYRCGKANCACHVSDERMHGPYIQWTRSVEGKTVHRRLGEDQLEEYQPYFDEARRIKELVSKLETVTLRMVERDTRWEHT